jgi:hypothetical protein
MSETIQVKDDVRHVMTHIIALGTRAVQEGRDRRGVSFAVSRDVWERLIVEVSPSLNDGPPVTSGIAFQRGHLWLYAPWGETHVEVNDALPPGRVELWVRHVTTVVAR